MPKPLYIPVALALAAMAVDLACSSSPRQYERGTFTPPPPAQQRPGVGLPTFEPHTKTLPPEPQPKPTRLLPETPETRRGPGFWASDAPPQDEPAVAFNWNVPLPEKDGEAAAKIEACAKDMAVASPRVPHKHIVDKLDTIAIVWRECWPHHAVLSCLKAERDGIGLIRPLNPFQQKRWDAVDRAIARAALSWAEHCNAAPLKPDLEHLGDMATSLRGVR